MRHPVLLGLAFLLAASTDGASAPEPSAVPVGLAEVDITPDDSIRLSGYAARTKESIGVESRLKAKALAIGADDSGPAILVSVDNCGVGRTIVDEVANRLKARVKLPRERFAVSSTHTHCAPWLSQGIPFIFGAPLPADQKKRVDRYTRELTDSIEKVALAALAARRPAKLAWSQGSVGFAVNRRMIKDGKWTGFGMNPGGPVDRSVPILRVADPDGKVRGVLVGYACHCTTLGGDFNKVCAEWAGYACDEVEKANPGSIAMVVIGCGADADPQPRLTVEITSKHGSALAAEVNRLMKAPMTALPGSIVAAYREIELPLAPLPERGHYAEMTKRPGSEGYFARTMLERLDRGESLPKSVRYPVQTWCFGESLAMVFLGGEVVVDYALRLKRECEPARLWVVAYTNDVPCYIASKRVLAEGGYEADSSMIYYGQPTRLAPEAEDRIVEAVHALLPEAFEGQRR
jgi:hypothetical protein